MRVALLATLLLSCAPKRAAEPQAPAPYVARGSPIPTKLKVPDAGPFDFSQRLAEEQKPFVTGDMAHPGQLSGYR